MDEIITAGYQATKMFDKLPQLIELAGVFVRLHNFVRLEVTMKTLLVIIPGTEVMQDGVFNILVAETGEHLASHFCSNSLFAYYDLYVHRPERIKEWTKRFGELDVKYINETNISEETLIKRNKEWYAKASATKIA